MPARPVAQLTWYNIVVTVGVIMTAAAGGWTIFQSQLNSLERQLQTADRDITKQITEAVATADRLRARVIQRDEHTELVKRIDIEIATINERIKILETTRPTTGELQALGAASTRDISEIKDRVRSLEDNLRKLPIKP